MTDGTINLNLGDDLARELCSVLSNDTNIKILQLCKNEKLFISEIAERLELTEANISDQVRRLQKVGLITTQYLKGVHGVRKIVRPCFDKIVIDFL